MNHEPSVIDKLRPIVEPFDPAWSAQTLTTILEHDAPAARRPRRRRMLLIAVPLVTAAAVLTALVPSLVDVPGDAGASAAAVTVLTQAAVTLESQIPDEQQYLKVTHVNRYWQGAEERSSRSTVTNWVPGDAELPMIEQTTQDGRITDTGAHSLAEYDTHYYTRTARTATELLDDLDNAAKEQDSDNGDYAKNVWDQAFRELQNAAVPVRFKADVLRALRELPGVAVRPTADQIGSLSGTALVLQDDVLAFVFDESSKIMLGISIGVDNPKAEPIKTPSTWELRTSIVSSAPQPD